MLDIKFENFFDRPKVIRKVRDGTKSALSKIGSFVRTRAKTSMRRRRDSASPGNPPSAHVGLMRDLMLFAYQETVSFLGSVIIGPKLFKTKQSTPEPIPHILEFGGMSTNSKGQPALYKKFPYMAPALEAEKDHIPDAFAGCVSE